MIVTIWRHGEAGQAVDDRERELTDNGADDIGFGCHQLQATCEVRNIAPPELILHSPWRRTTQTAEIIGGAFTHATLRVAAALRPGSNPTGVDDALTGLLAREGECAHLVLVSHQPLVSRLVDHYLGDGTSVPGLSPGALAVLRLEVPARACGQLLFWAMPPEYEAGL